MKKVKLFIWLGLILISFSTLAQGPGPANHDEMDESKREKIQSMKIAYITKQLELTTEEAEKFWPVYNELEAKKKELRKARKANRPAKPEDGEQAVDLTDKEIEAMILNEFDLKQKELDLEKEYFEKFKEVLPLRKIAKLHHAEKSFNREILRKMKDHKKSGPPNKPGRQ